MCSLEYQNSKRYNYSAVFIIVALVMLHWSQAMFFVGGQLARMGSLAVGFSLIILAAIIRARGQIINLHLSFILLTGAYFILLVLLTLFQEHEIIYDKQQQIFTLVCLFLFWSGYILAREKRHDFVSANQWSLLGIGFLALLCLLRFLQFVKSVSFEGSERGFGESTLNAVGVAFANSCLVLVFLMLAILDKNIFRKLLYLLVSGVAFFVVLSTASRGATLWGLLTIIFFFILNRNRTFVTARGLLVAFLCIILMVPILALLYRANYAIAERIDILIDRYMSVFDYFTGLGDSDNSVDARYHMWRSYLSTIDQWIFLGEKRNSGYPHNQWLEIFVKFGLLGIPMFLMSVILFLKITWSILREKLYPDIEFSIIVTLFMFGYLSSMTSLSLQTNRVLWLGFGYLLGYYFERSKRQNCLQPSH